MVMTKSKRKFNFKQNAAVYVMLIPVLAYYIIFHYAPMGGLVMAFQNYRPNLGLLGSDWVGLDNFSRFFSSIYFGRLLRNTLLISVKDILVSFPAAIIFALLLNEVRSKYFKKTVQTISYLPYFISMVVICGLVMDFTEAGGAISNVVAALGGPSDGLISNPKYFQSVFIGSNVWQNLGYSSIIYLSALSAIDQEQYESARMDGAGRFKQTIYITLPALATTITVMLLLRMGHLMTVNYQKVILLYSPATYETADVISSYVYRIGLLGQDYSYAASVDFFNSVINLSILCVANWASRKYSETSLW